MFRWLLIVAGLGALVWFSRQTVRKYDPHYLSEQIQMEINRQLF